MNTMKNESRNIVNEIYDEQIRHTRKNFYWGYWLKKWFAEKWAVIRGCRHTFQNIYNKKTKMLQMQACIFY